MAENNEVPQDKMPLEECLLAWRGFLAFGDRQVPIILRLISGSSSLPGTCIHFYGDPLPVLRLQTTLRISEVDVQDIKEKAKDRDQHSILIGLPGAAGTEGLEVFQNAQHLKRKFVDYLFTRRSVAFAHLPSYLEEQESYSLHVFPHCLFSGEIIQRLVPEEFPKLNESAYLLFILTKNSS